MVLVQKQMDKTNGTELKHQKSTQTSTANLYLIEDLKPIPGARTVYSINGAGKTRFPHAEA